MWIPRRTATRLTIWRTSNSPIGKIEQGLVVLLGISVFLVFAGYHASVTCSRSISGAPIECEVLQGNLFATEYFRLFDVSEAHVTSCGKNSTCAAIEHAGRTVIVSHLDPIRVVGLVSRYVFQDAVQAREISVDMRSLGVLGALVFVGGSIGWLWYSLAGYEWTMVDLDKTRNYVVVRRQVLFGPAQLEAHHLSEITAVRCRERRVGSTFPQVRLVMPGRDLFLWEDVESPRLAERIRVFLNLPE
jgi:hypothetical protein